MPLFMDHHRHVEGLSADAVADAHRKDEQIQDEYGVTYLKSTGSTRQQGRCLLPGGGAEQGGSAEAVHREAHGLLADEITEVTEGAVSRRAPRASPPGSERAGAPSAGPLPFPYSR